MQQIFTKIIFFALSLTFLISCNSIKYVPENENLLKTNIVYVNEKKNFKEKINNYLVQRPNQSVIGIPLSLHFYNIGNPEFDKTFEDWVIHYPDKYETYEKLFSKKQTNVIYRTNSGFNNWFLKKGQAPVIFDESKAKKTAKSLDGYFHTNGFFDVEVNYEIRQVDNKQVEVDYKIITNKQYFIDSLTPEIESPVIDSIYQANINNSMLKPKAPFIFDDFEQEENRLVSLFRNSGVYQFKRNSMGFWTDSIKNIYEKDIVLKIPDRIIREGDSVYKEPYRMQKVKEINIYTDFSIANRGKKNMDSVHYKGYNFYSYGKLNYKPKYLVNSLFISPNEYFKDAERTLTRNHLRNLNTFSSSVDINYTENEDNSLTANVYLNPLKKYALTFDLDATTSNIKPFGILGKFSFLGRNIFKGSETLELAFQGAFYNVANDASNSSQFFNAWEMMSSASLKFPRILFPVNTSAIIPKYMAPKTSVDASVSFQKNIGLDKQSITAGMAYTWKTSKKIGHRVDFMNLQYIKNKNIDNYFSIYNSEYQKLNDVTEDVFGQTLPQDNDDILEFMDFFLNPSNGYQDTNPDEYNSVSDVSERRDILIEDVMVPVISYSFVINSRKNIEDNNFSYFTARFVSSGLISSALVSKTNEIGQKVLFDVPIAQYFKVELEYKKYWELRKNNILIFRTFIGAAIPYGNSTDVPFTRSYSAGGSNEMRAWRTWDLGPGGELNNLEYKVSTFKLVSNLEYRFKVTDKIHSALFIDAGNIWDITDSNLVSEEGKLTSFSSFKNTAVGSGFGIRYDFGFLVFRFDIGFKTYEPYLPTENKWFLNYNFANATYNIGINYPF